MKFIFSALVLAASGSAFAQNTGEAARVSSYAINLGSPDFSAVAAHYDTTIEFDTAAHTLSNTLNLPALATSISVYALGSATLTHGSETPGTVMPLLVSTPGGTGQGWGWNYDLTASSSPGTTMTVGQSAGRHSFTFSGGGTGFVETGGSFLEAMVFNGDWSAASSHSVATFSAGYTVVDNFTYANGVTTFAVETDAYDQTDPDVRFTLYGANVAAVPEASTWALMLGGLGLVSGFARRRSAHQATR